MVAYREWIFKFSKGYKKNPLKSLHAQNTMQLQVLCPIFDFFCVYHTEGSGCSWGEVGGGGTL